MPEFRIILIWRHLDKMCLEVILKDETRQIWCDNLL